MNNQRKLLQKLTKLAAENPKLDIIYVVDTDVCVDYNIMALAEARQVRMDRYVMVGDDYCFRDDMDAEELAEQLDFECNGVDLKEMNQKELEEWFENLPWHEAIFVLIGSVE